MAEKLIGYDYDGNPIYQDTVTGASRVDTAASTDKRAGAGITEDPTAFRGDPNKSGFFGGLGKAVGQGLGYVLTGGPVTDAVGEFIPGVGSFQDKVVDIGGDLYSIPGNALDRKPLLKNTALDTSRRSTTTPTPGAGAGGGSAPVAPAPPLVAPEVKRVTAAPLYNYGEEIDANQAERDAERAALEKRVDEATGLEYDPTFYDETKSTLAYIDKLIADLADFDPEAAALRNSEAAFRQQLSAAGATRGGIGAQNLARNRAQRLAPQLQAEARTAADAEQARRQEAAVGLLGTRGNVATTAFGLTNEQAVKKAQLGLDGARVLAEVTGADWQLTSEEATAFYDFQTKMTDLYLKGEEIDTTRMLGILDAEMKRYGIDATTGLGYAQLAADIEAGKIGPDDILLAVLGNLPRVSVGK